MEVIERVTSNDEGWNNPRSKSYRVASASENNQLDLMSKQMELLNKKIDFMRMGMPQQEEPGRVEDVNYVHQGGNSFYTNNYRPNQGGGGGYNNYGYKTHPNLSYGNTSNTLKPPPGFQVSQGEIVETKKMCSEDVLNAFMQETGRCFKVTNSRLERLEADVHSLTVHMKSVDTQLSQIAQAMSNQHTPGQLPSQPKTNPKDCKAIYLRSGTSYEGPSIPEFSSKAVEEPAVVERVVEEEAGKEIKQSEKKVPFPQLLQKQKQAEKFSKFWDILKKVHVNIPLIDALKQIPGYAKFLKEAISKKKKWGDYETVNLAENCSAILKRKLPAKVKDHGSFTIECSIGDCFVGNALCDLGASINLMALFLYKKMKLGPLKPTSITLQMADR